MCIYLIAVLRLWRQLAYGKRGQRPILGHLVKHDGVCGNGRARKARTRRVVVYVGYVVPRRG